MANALGVPSPDKVAYMDTVAAANSRFHDHPHVEIHLGDGHALPTRAQAGRPAAHR
ncbi:hypothetical protein [Lentzea aerocolonigenes]|uniref:hypothetical protein n=1 Tax=Lentzea aerocolonigenes TaxID=68170 RepID=UPI000B1F8B1E|nr:hypothetical protein [Lentzea aerocolonigenes]MCP2247749.1 hypothetical protein [Lentzea aerocolonigenes]